MLLGIEIGGTKLQLGVGGADGKIDGLERLQIDPARGAAGILAQIESAIEPLLLKVGLGRGDIEGVGIGFGGPVDSASGAVIKSHQVDGWDDFPLADWFSWLLKTSRVSIENDADTAGLAEARIGAGAGTSPVLYVTIGSGVGGGLILDDRIYRGWGGGATEIGHLRIGDGDDPPTLESIASGWGIGEKARRLVEQNIREGGTGGSMPGLAAGPTDRINAEIVARAASQGDPLSLAVLKDATHAMAIALGHATTLLAPRTIVLGGGVSLMGEELWFEPIRRELHRRVFGPFRGTYRLVPASLGERVVVHGALILAGSAA
ncbi:ROK family protein [Isosphaeraceae bacterium EP7]